jgi:hypothetical protein
MKLFSYYLQIMLPFLFLFALSKLFGSFTFVVGLFFYVFVYRPFVDGYKLLRTGLIDKNSFWKLFIPFNPFRLKFFHQLYFENK